MYDSSSLNDAPMVCEMDYFNFADDESITYFGGDIDGTGPMARNLRGILDTPHARRQGECQDKGVFIVDRYAVCYVQRGWTPN